MAVKAIAKGVRISPRKVGVVAALIRGRTVSDAVTILSHVPRRGPALAIKKAVESAAANAEHNHNLKPGTLSITEISISPGPRLKRYRPASHGRALPFMRRTSHIRVVVDGEVRAPKKAVQAKAKEDNTGKETK